MILRQLLWILLIFGIAGGCDSILEGGQKDKEPSRKSANLNIEADSNRFDYLLLATSRTSTMKKEMNQAAEAGYRFATVMGGGTAFAGSEIVVVMAREPDKGQGNEVDYTLLATNKTSTMQKELNEAGAAGFKYCGQSVCQTSMGGQEVVIILERKRGSESTVYNYKLLATNKTKTMQKELREAGAAEFRILGMTVGSTSFGGSEVVCILGKRGEH
ncbi:hypothetical protein ACFLU6_08865 [Acidobacteriota bacterium]